MAEEKSFTVILNQGTEKEQKIPLDYRICKYDVSIFNEELNIEEPAPLNLIHNPRVI